MVAQIGYQRTFYLLLARAGGCLASVMNEGVYPGQKQPAHRAHYNEHDGHFNKSEAADIFHAEHVS